MPVPLEDPCMSVDTLQWKRDLMPFQAHVELIDSNRGGNCTVFI